MQYDSLSPNEQIRALTDELYVTRRTLVNAMPEQFRNAFAAHDRCETKQQYWDWELKIVQKVIEMAVPLTREEGSYYGPRAYCPLCGQSSQAPYESGFALPEGLKRHLEGWGNAKRCSIMNAALALARDNFQSAYDPAAAQQAEAMELERRRATETLYKVSPDGYPFLLDQMLDHNMTPRDETELAWAEQRLAELGFQLTVTDRVKQYLFETGNVVVFADPRAHGQISFSVYRKPPRKNGREKFLKDFSIKDSWTRNIKTKFESKIGEAFE